MPARSPGKAGRSRGPAAPSCSSTCFRTGERRRRRGLVKTRTLIRSRCTCQGLTSRFVLLSVTADRRTNYPLCAETRRSGVRGLCEQ
uniref:Uncharacterized protein n=1 Tax=Poecilia latipinna TaxID=48699 RepID=A0A3B3TL29_9TELE